MDKIAANNHFVLMRKEIKKAKVMVSGNLIRKIAKLKLEKDKLEDEAKIGKIDAKIASILKEIKLLKTLDPYNIAKNATLNPDPKLWNKIISDSKATTEEISIARIIIKNNIQKQVMRFRTDYKDYDEWINEYIEYREKKREIEEASSKSSKRNFNAKKNKNREGNQENFSKVSSPTKAPTARKQPNVTKKNDCTNSEIGESPNPKRDIKQAETLHPSWEVKRKQKELLKAALSGELSKPKSIKFE